MSWAFGWIIQWRPLCHAEMVTQTPPPASIHTQAYPPGSLPRLVAVLAHLQWASGRPARLHPACHTEMATRTLPEAIDRTRLHLDTSAMRSSAASCHSGTPALGTWLAEMAASDLSDGNGHTDTAIRIHPDPDTPTGLAGASSCRPEPPWVSSGRLKQRHPVCHPERLPQTPSAGHHRVHPHTRLAGVCGSPASIHGACLDGSARRKGSRQTGVRPFRHLCRRAAAPPVPSSLRSRRH